MSSVIEINKLSTFTDIIFRQPDGGTGHFTVWSDGEIGIDLSVPGDNIIQVEVVKEALKALKEFGITQ